MNPNLSPSSIVDFKAPNIQALVAERNWLSLSADQAVGEIYTFVKDEIKFGYNAGDDLPASQVLADGYGQCNTKASLLMALLRAVNIPCRFRGLTVDNGFQKGAIPAYLFWIAPKKILHSWVEVYFNHQWIELEGVIIDKPYLTQIQHAFNQQNCGAFKGYAIATSCLQSPKVDWQAQSTYIQKESIVDDFGIYDHPDQFYQQQGTNFSGVKRWLYANLIRHLMNSNVNKIRQYGLTK